MRRTTIEQRGGQAWPFFPMMTSRQTGSSLVDLTDAAWRQGFEILEAWLDGVQRVWMANWRLLEPSVSGAEGSRRTSDSPWLPHIEAMVIPLRRRSDPLGGEATRVSMRVPLLWPLGGAEALSVEAIMGAGQGEHTDATAKGEIASAPAGKSSHVTRRASSNSS